MSYNQKKVNIFIPLEIKKRELQSKVILSTFLINNNKNINARCYIGSKSQIKKIIFSKKSYGGIFLYKGGYPFYLMENIKKKIQKFIVLDEEIGPATTNHLTRDLPNRLWSGTEKFIDGYYLIGKYAKNITEKVFPDLIGKLKITGWPRVDLWRPEFNSMYKSSVESLKAKYGDFILFSSDFTFITKKRIQHEQNYWKDSEWKNMSENIDKITQKATRNFLEYQENLKFIQELDKHSDIPQIIIRPHPSDDLLEWRRLNKSFKRIKVIYEGDVTSWIHAAKGVLHRGCTSAVEAYMMGIPAGYVITNKDWIRKSVPFAISEHLNGVSQIIDFCKRNIVKKPVPPKAYIEEFNYVVHVEKKYSCEIIAEDIFKTDLTHELSCDFSSINFLLDTLKVNFNYFKSYIIKVAKKYRTGVLLPNKLFGGITKKEIDDILDSFDKDHKFKVRQVLKDCVEIE